MLVPRFEYYFYKFALVTLVAISLSACNAHDASQVDIPMVAGVEVIKNISYGNHKKQRMDIYKKGDAKRAPIIVNLHGGGWSSGDKNESLSYINKVNRWVPNGFILISVGTRLMPKADVYTQISDLAEAVAYVQKHAAGWGGDGSRLILMGHSSAGTMVSVLAADPTVVTALGGKRWLASIAIDSSSLDIARTMRLWSPDMFTYAYGKDDKRWSKASPISLLNSQSLPILITCSTQRADSPCEQAALFAAEAKKFGIKTKITSQDFDHGGMDFNLGLDPEYTNTVETFMASLDSEISRLLSVITKN